MLPEPLAPMAVGERRARRRERMRGARPGDRRPPAPDCRARAGLSSSLSAKRAKSGHARAAAFLVLTRPQLTAGRVVKWACVKHGPAKVATVPEQTRAVHLC